MAGGRVSGRVVEVECVAEVGVHEQTLEESVEITRGTQVSQPDQPTRPPHSLTGVGP